MNITADHMYREMRNTSKIFSENLKGRDHLEDLEINRVIILQGA
jgi:hypothetical protein